MAGSLQGVARSYAKLSRSVATEMCGQPMTPWSCISKILKFRTHIWAYWICISGGRVGWLSRWIHVVA